MSTNEHVIEFLKAIVGKLEGDTPNYQVLPYARKLLKHLTDGTPLHEAPKVEAIAPVAEVEPVATEPEVIAEPEVIVKTDEETQEEQPKPKRTRAAAPKSE